MIDFSEAEKYVAQNKELIIGTLADFALTDTLLFWSDKEELKTLQQQQWQPVLNWLAQRLNLHFCTTEDFCLPQENERSSEIFAAYLRTLSLKPLTALYLAATNLKSPLLATMFLAGKLSASEVFDLAFLEELYQVRQWGEDTAAANLRQIIRDDLNAIEEYIKNGKMFTN